MGGNRVGKLKLVRNILIVWALTGIWHGANWTFILWGLLFGILLIIEKFVWLNKLEKAPKIFNHIYVLFIVMISFMIFNSDDISQAKYQILGLIGANGENFINAYTLYYLKSYAVILIIAIVGATPMVKNIIGKLKESNRIKKAINFLEPMILISLMLIITAYLVVNSYNPFLYFRF